MAAKVNELICEEYDHDGKSIIYGDTDSHLGSTVIRTNKGNVAVEELFESCTEFWNNGDKEYANDSTLKVLSYDPSDNTLMYDSINYIYRHKVTKDLYEIEDELGNIVTVTEDHSVMVEREGILCEVKPMDIQENDILISVLDK
jgi:intein/homing endonuclease